MRPAVLVMLARGLVLVSAGPQAGAGLDSPPPQWGAAARAPDGRSWALVSDTWLCGGCRRMPSNSTAAETEDSRRNFAAFNTPVFSADGRSLYFPSSIWVTSNTLHRIDLQTGQEHYLIEANDLRLAGAGAQGALLRRRHRYLEGGGA